MEFAATSPHQVTARVVAQTIPRALWFWRTVRCISHHLIVALPTSECLAALVSLRQLCCCFKGVPETRVIACPSRHDSPGGARHRVGQSHGRKREWSRGQHHPGPVGARWIASYPTSSGRGRHGHQAPARCTNAGRPASRFVPAGACRRSLSVLARDRGKRRELPPTGEPPGIGQAGAEASGNQQPDAGDGRQSDAGSITPVGSKDPPCQACRPRNRG